LFVSNEIKTENSRAICN